MNYLITVLLVFLMINLSACSLFNDLPSVEDVQKTVKQVEANLTIADFANGQLFSAGIIDAEQSEENEKAIDRIRGNLKGVKMLLSLQKETEANNILEEIQRELDDLNSASSRQ